MKVPFSELPGRHERHFRRKLDNPLFPRPIREYGNEELLEVQRLDHEELLGFVSRLRDLVQQAVELKPNEESQVVLNLKEGLDKLYEQACGVADDQTGNKEAIRQLLAVIMRTVRAHAADDPVAEGELEQEHHARTAHFSLLEQAVVADLLAPDSPIQQDELVATLLSEDEQGLAAALQLFDAAQLADLCAQGQKLIALRQSQEILPAVAQERLQQMLAQLQLLAPQESHN